MQCCCNFTRILLNSARGKPPLCSFWNDSQSLFLVASSGSLGSIANTICWRRRLSGHSPRQAASIKWWSSSQISAGGPEGKSELVLSLLEYSDPARQTRKSVSLKNISSPCGRLKLLFSLSHSRFMSSASPRATAGKYDITSRSSSAQLSAVKPMSCSIWRNKKFNMSQWSRPLVLSGIGMSMHALYKSNFIRSNALSFICTPL